MFIYNYVIVSQSTMSEFHLSEHVKVDEYQYWWVKWLLMNIFTAWQLWVKH